MVGLLGCGCCGGDGGGNPSPNCRCFPVYWDDPDFAEYRASADYSWSYNQCENEYNRIVNGVNYTSAVSGKCLHVRDGRFFKWKKGQFEQEVAPHPSAGQWFDKEHRMFGQRIGPACILKTSSIELRTHNLLWETDTHINARAALASVDYGYIDPYTPPIVGKKFTYGCTQKVYPDFNWIGDGYRFWHGVLIQQLGDSRIEETATYTFGPPNLFYVVWIEGTFGNPGSGEDGYANGITVLYKQPVPWGQNRIGVGLSIPDRYPEPAGGGGGIPLRFRFYLNSVQTYSFEIENGVEAAYVNTCPTENGFDWAVRGCIAHVSDWWIPRFLFAGPSAILPNPKPYHSQNPEDALAFDDVAFTKHLKPATRP